MAAQIEEWQKRAEGMTALNLKAIEGGLAELDAHLTLRSYIVGYSLTDADTTVWRTLRENRVAHAYIKQGLMANLSRWFKYIEETSPETATLPVRPAKGGKAGEEKAAKDEGGNFDIGLQEVEGTVITRFPPEPSYMPQPQLLPIYILMNISEAIYTSDTRKPPFSMTTSRTRSTRESSSSASTIQTQSRRNKSSRMLS
jgi:hypothetical protein